MTTPLDTNKDWNKDVANSNKLPQSRIVDTNSIELEKEYEALRETIRWAVTFEYAAPHNKHKSMQDVIDTLEFRIQKVIERRLQTAHNSVLDGVRERMPEHRPHLSEMYNETLNDPKTIGEIRGFNEVIDQVLQILEEMKS